MKGFKAYTLKENWIIRKAQEEPRQPATIRQYPTMPNRAARILALNAIPNR